MICLLKCIHVQADSVILFYVIVIGLRAQIVMIDEFILVINEFIYHCWLNNDTCEFAFCVAK